MEKTCRRTWKEDRADEESPLIRLLEVKGDQRKLYVKPLREI